MKKTDSITNKSDPTANICGQRRQGVYRPKRHISQTLFEEREFEYSNTISSIDHTLSKFLTSGSTGENLSMNSSFVAFLAQTES